MVLESRIMYTLLYFTLLYLLTGDSWAMQRYQPDRLSNTFKYLDLVTLQH